MEYTLVISYDGTHYQGWKDCKTGPSVEGAVTQGLEKVLQHPIKLDGVSRLDRGVHARCQLATFTTKKSPDRIQYGLNSLLARDIRICDVTAGKPRVLKKEYRYYLSKKYLPYRRDYVWHLPHGVDIDLMRQGARHFVGKHDFESMTNAKNNESYACHIRHLSRACVRQVEDMIEIILVADRFTYKMARNIVGTLVACGEGKITPEDIPVILTEKSRVHLGVTAPAHGLFLHKIYTLE